jgi:hypothetical protein
VLDRLTDVGFPPTTDGAPASSTSSTGTWASPRRGSFQTVHELLFDDGRLVRAHDRSPEITRVREEILRGDRPDPDAAGDLIGWIGRTFELDYGRTFGGDQRGGDW